MTDRLPTPGKEGRVKIVAEDGTIIRGVLTMDDDPLDIGTPLNKATLLKDDTAALSGLGSDAVPDDVLRVLGRFHTGLGNEYVWEHEGPAIEPTQTQTTTLSETLGPVLLTAPTIQYASSIELDESNTKYYLVNPETFYLPNIATSDMQTAAVNAISSVLSGKYIQSSDLTELFDVHRFLSVVPGSDSYTVDISAVKIEPRQITKFLDYVNSPDPGAYPAEDSAGNKYSLIGQIGNKANVITGSYTGTGTDSHTLTFERLPTFLVIYQSEFELYGNAVWVFWASGVTLINTVNPDQYPFLRTNFSVSGNSLTITGSGGSADQNPNLAFNVSSKTYQYIAFVI